MSDNLCEICGQAKPQVTTRLVCEDCAGRPARSKVLLAELCGILSAALARGLGVEHSGCRVLLELPMTEDDYMRLRMIVEATATPPAKPLDTRRE